MHVQFTVEVESVRVFFDGDTGSYDRRDRIDTVALIKYSGNEAHVSLGHGEYTRPVLREIESHCKASGATSIRWEHHGKNHNKELTNGS